MLMNGQSPKVCVSDSISQRLLRVDARYIYQNNVRVVLHKCVKWSVKTVGYWLRCVSLKLDSSVVAVSGVVLVPLRFLQFVDSSAETSVVCSACCARDNKVSCVFWVDLVVEISTLTGVDDYVGWNDCAHKILYETTFWSKSDAQISTEWSMNRAWVAPTGR